VNRLEPHLFYGLDLGCRQDPSALAVVERLHLPTGEVNHVTYEREFRLAFVLRHIGVFRLGTPYTQVVRRVERLLKQPRTLQGYELQPGHLLRPDQTLVVDATGVGSPVVESLRAADLPGRLHPVTITGAGHPHGDPFGGELVPRLDLLSNLRMLMERELLRVPAGVRGRDALFEELLRATDPAGGAHDDRVIAVALAVWQSTRGLAAWLHQD
jgi:hypothetical protein